MPWFGIGLMASQLIGGMVTSTSSGQKVAKKKAENQQLINSYQDSLKSMHDLIDKMKNDSASVTKFFEDQNEQLKKQQKEIITNSTHVIMKAQDIQNELYRISIIFSILFGTLFIVLLVKFIRRPYIVTGCPYAYTKFKNPKKK